MEKSLMCYHVQGRWMFQGTPPFARSLKANSMSKRTFESCREMFNPTGRYSVRYPVEKPGRVTLPRPGEEVMFYHLVQVGMRIPFAPLLLELLQCFGLAPALLTPPGFIKWIAFIRMCQLLRVKYSLTAFRCLFRACIRPKGVTGFTSRSFSLSGPAAAARGAEMCWEGMILSEERISSHYRRSYFMYEGPGLVDWDVNPKSPGPPALEDLSNDDIHCLKAFCRLQMSGSFEPLSWKVLYGQGMSALHLQPGSWSSNVLEPVPRVLHGSADYAHGYERGCYETRQRVAEQLYRYNREFPFGEIPEISFIGTSLALRSGGSAGVGTSHDTFPIDTAGPSTATSTGEDEGAGRGAIVGDAAAREEPASPGIKDVIQDWGEDWSFLNTTAVQEAQEGWDFLNVAGIDDGGLGLFRDPWAVPVKEEEGLIPNPSWSFSGMNPGFPWS